MFSIYRVYSGIIIVLSEYCVNSGVDYCVLRILCVQWYDYRVLLIVHVYVKWYDYCVF